MKLDYHYGRQAFQYAMVEIPLLMFVDDAFEPLSIEAKVVYGILLQRIKLANRNGWRDEEGRLYVVYPLDQMHNKNLIRIYPSKSSQMDGMRFDSDETASRLYVREDLGTDHLCEMYPADEEKIRGIEDLIVDVLTSNRQKMFVGGEERETNMVKGRFMKLTESHIETVLGKWDELTKKPNNARAYLLTMLYNVSITAKAEFQARMRQDAQNNFRVDDNCAEELMEG